MTVRQFFDRIALWPKAANKPSIGFVVRKYFQYLAGKTSCRHCGIWRKTGYKILTRYNEIGPGG